MQLKNRLIANAGWIGETTGRLLVTGVPAGIPIADEKSFTPSSSPIDIARIVDASRKHGIYFVPELQKQNY